MSFLNLSPAIFWLGLAGLAAGLYALQRLRVRHREVSVPTLLFWREAIEEAPARVLVERFRHLPAYLLVLAIAGALWLAMAGPRSDAAPTGERYLLLVDGSAIMADGERLQAAIEAAAELAAELPADRRTIMWCGAEPRTVLLPGEPARLVRERLAEAQAEPAPASLERAIRGWSQQAGERSVIVLGDSDWQGGFLDSVGLDVLRWPLDTDERTSNNGVRILGISSARSGDPLAVDALVVTRDASASVQVSLNDTPRTPTSEMTLAGGLVLHFRDLPADGGHLQVRLAGSDGVALDDQASRVLPVRRALRVALDPSLPQVFTAAIAADRGLQLAADPAAADVVVRANASFGAGLPALEWNSRDAQQEPLLITHDAGADSTEALSQLVPKLGLDRIDAQALATATGAPFAVGARPGAMRSIGLWNELLDADGADMASSRAFPVLVSRGLRWLGGSTEFPAEISAGRPLSSTLQLLDREGATLQAFGAASVPPYAGEWAAADGSQQAVALLSDLTPAGAGAEALPDLESSGPSAITLLILAAMGLLALEWFLVRTGRMP